jgi:hypothetical protein
MGMIFPVMLDDPRRSADDHFETYIYRSGEALCVLRGAKCERAKAGVRTCFDAVGTVVDGRI